MLRLMTLAFGIAALPVPSLAQSSAGARWLVDQTLNAYCTEGGQFDRSGIIEADLTGDGRADLVLYTAGITCNGGGTACGAVYCDVMVFVREGELLVNRFELMTQCAEIEASNPPGLRTCARDGSEAVFVWDGAGFSPRG